MKQETLQIAQQESATATAIEADPTKSSSKCPFAQNGGETNENTDLNGTGEDTSTMETNGTATIRASVKSEKPTGLGSFKVAKIETVKENLEAQSLTVQQINDYCKSLFIFKSIRVMRFK